jgi:hypothetical protein
MASHCKRCWKTFKNPAQLDSHMAVAAVEICEVQPGYPPEGISPELKERLKSRKSASPNQSAEDMWKNMYRLLFPGEEVPSPCKFLALHPVLQSSMKMLLAQIRSDNSIYSVTSKQIWSHL